MMRLCFAVVLASLSAWSFSRAEATEVQTELPLVPAAEKCLECHAEDVGSIRFGDGTKRTVQVPRKGWTDSVHGGQLSCTDCHREIAGHPHAVKPHKTQREYTIQMSGTCQRCHYAYYTRVLDSIHYEMIKAGQFDAPTCVDCHGSHEIHSPGRPRISVNLSCAKCHSDIHDIYKKSVHGKALMQTGNEDVPLCTDCHGAHSITDPTSGEFHVQSHEICAKCHGDAKRMKPYGLNPDVLTSYLADFHGASNRIYSQSHGVPKKPIASCIDCHGVHDIQAYRQKNSGSPEAIKASTEAVRLRVITACRKCHEAVPQTFANAWLSHYAPSLERTPLVWLVKWLYKIMIPLIMAGLVLHILLHLWRLYKKV